MTRAAPSPVIADRPPAALAAAMARLAPLRRDSVLTVADWFEEAVAEAGDRPFLIFQDLVISYAAMNTRANRVAHAALASGLTRGDVAALLMENRPDYLATWLGLAKIGVVTALINTTATGRALVHALDQAGATALVVGTELRHALAPIAPAELPGLILERSSHDDMPGEHPATHYDQRLAEVSVDDPPRAMRAGLTLADCFLYIFTSGTTGLPKAARISNLRFVASGIVVAGGLSFGPDDVFYCVLPLFHGAGGMVVPAVSIASRTPFVLRRRFSRSAFWTDVRRHRITAFYYIGEIARFLLSAEPRDDDRDHTLRIMTGAGLRPELWDRFATRFGIHDIQEGLGSTEGNYRLMNLENRVGSVGRLPPPDRTNIRIVRYDQDNGALARDADGRGALVGPGEIGELVAQVIDGTGLNGYFEGYTSREASEAKLVRRLFADGDCWFRSGDLVRVDAEGFVYFVDRSGDTFRWKGENVSTQEVEEALAGHPGVATVAVYGVTVPGHEGRAGMAAVTTSDPVRFDLEALHARAVSQLADYAVPLFVRIGVEADMTATFKLRKNRLQDEAYGVAAAERDRLFVRDAAAGGYVPLTEDMLRRLDFLPQESIARDAA